MAGEVDLKTLLKEMTPKLHPGEYVFSIVETMAFIPQADIIGMFKEQEGITIILNKIQADHLNLKYDYIASWITLEVHSSLHAVGFTAFFSTALAKHGISCNVVAGYYHDHLFVDSKEGPQALKVLKNLASV